MTTITCKIPEQLNAELEAAARRRGLRKSAIVREALEDRLKSTTSKRGVSAFDLVRHISGKLRGPCDLSTNPKHLEDFGA